MFRKYDYVSELKTDSSLPVGNGVAVNAKYDNPPKQNIEQMKARLAVNESDVYKVALDDVLNGMLKIACNQITKEEALYIYKESINAEKEYDVPHQVLLGMAAQESNFINHKDSYKGPTYGRGPFMISDITRTDFYYKTGKKYTAEDCYDWPKAFEMACWAYKYNHTGYGVEDNPKALIIAYNVGQNYYHKNKKYLLNGQYPNGGPYRHYKYVSEMMDIMGFKS